MERDCAELRRARRAVREPARVRVNRAASKDSRPALSYPFAMGKHFESIDARMEEWIRAQHLFFVATAPAGVDGHVNLSPKGLDSFAILGPTEVAYLDLVGSGAETIAHLRENGRITLMFCAFEGPPKIVRLYGRGAVVEPQDAEFVALRRRFALTTPARSIVRIELTRIADSCGYGVPVMRHESERKQLTDWADRKDDAAIRAYQLKNNRESLDGLPALRWPESSS